MLALRAAGEGAEYTNIRGRKAKKSAAQLGISTEGKSVEDLATEVADILT